ncbi:protein eyes shut homolog isoform X2 [Hydra vulgaris]|uniref:protein eyes shut homolog isoform X2 n=1 Tax=Hydra vulgaris TaxID=6087 RepID=UPI001F5EC1A1|nr:protein eyes shut homolog isoform X2 [Hydra vulgaris]
MNFKESLFTTKLTPFWMAFSLILQVLTLEKNCSSCDEFTPLCISNFSRVLYKFSNEQKYLCESKQLCFHENSTDSVTLQHKPLYILKNQSLTFSVDLFLNNTLQLYIFNESFYSDWNQCNTKNMSQILFFSNDHYLQMPILNIGKHYILFNTSKEVCLNGLRIQVNVIDHNCFNSSNNPTMLYMCSSNGKCTYNESLNIYMCKCCPGFLGQYCENKQDVQNLYQNVFDLKESEVDDFFKKRIECITCFKIDNKIASDVDSEYDCTFDKRLKDNNIEDIKGLLDEVAIKYNLFCKGNSSFSVVILNESITFDQFNRSNINLNSSCSNCQCYQKYLKKLLECKTVDRHISFVTSKTSLLEPALVNSSHSLNLLSSSALFGVTSENIFPKIVTWSTVEALHSTALLSSLTLYRSQVNLMSTPSLTAGHLYQSWPSVFASKKFHFSSSVTLNLSFETINPSSSLKQSTIYRALIFDSFENSITDAEQPDFDSLGRVTIQANASFSSKSSFYNGSQSHSCCMSSIVDQTTNILKDLKQASLFISESIKQSLTTTNSISLSQEEIPDLQLCLYPCFKNACLNNGTCFVDASNILGFRCACIDKFTGRFCDQLKDYCLNDPCNGGFCISINGGFKCLCQFGKTGVHCLQDSLVGIPLFSVYQNYSSFIKYSWNSTGDLVLQRLEIQLQFKRDSDKKTGELLIFSEKKGGIFFAVGIHDNFITVIFNFGNGVRIVKSHDELSVSRVWHYLVTGYSGQQVYIFIDNQPKVLYTCYEKLSYLDFTSALFIGGIPFNAILPKSVLLFFSSGFIGALYKLSLRTDNPYFTPILFKKLQNDLTETTNIQLENSLGIVMEAQSCQNQLCNNNGSCHEQENVFYCICLHPNKGILCQDTVLPCVEYNPCHPSSACYSDNNFDINCDCAFGKSGLFCQTTNNMNVSSSGDFLAIGLYSGYVLVRFNLGRNTVTLLSRTCVTPNNINRLHFQRINNQAVMKLNDDIYVGVRSSPLAVSLDVNSNFYIGGVPDFSVINTDISSEIKSNFVGCITHFKVNDKLYMLNSSNTDIVGRNIGEYNSCINNNCLNNASCSAEADYSYRCNCLLGFSGVFCEEELKTMTVASFDGSGYWMGQIETVRASLHNSFALSFRSTNDGLLFWYGRLQDDYGDMISVGLYNGTINVRYLIDGKEVSSSTEQLFNDGAYHRIHILRNGNAIFVWINLNKPDLVVSHSAQVSFVTDGYIYIGGLPGDVYALSGHRFMQGWIGCIANVTLSNEASFINFADKEIASGKNVKPCS